ncbi:hypothetical protein SERLA73DRAFT_185039 [Serpula lacrymans var. lacrymans S7.3]|uniref:Uncharacterized protein n=2 Tax=Serpula lacrymans var. lacrymans TaxID=341189 RepID=F8Q3Y6_SERL3|nr:uncharacterized protein SERLADRAFT_473264 [Serpula lacrymans var. lacrymans S7.9]EGN96842.1 hypothetical protein SERLA73DRAFT_185039 [Serpula lacrymans var. lacrymans S7.3]EGO22443.1 hypothetical protein SERLADRAFT_473264 [Serpula lacrymans var. lacrymans S7.9]
MSDSFSTSPELPKVVKVKYSGRAKRRRSVVDNTEISSQDEENLSPAESMGDKSVVQTPRKSEKDGKRKTGPKKVEVHLPGPSPPKRKRLDHEENQDSVKKPSSKSIHRRNSSVVSLRGQDLQESPAALPTFSKPLSAAGSSSKHAKSLSVSSKRPDTPDSEDAVSIAESSNSRVRRTEAERIQIFKDDENCGEMEPQRVFCLRCSKWISVGPKYSLNPWERHRTGCDRRSPRPKQTITTDRNDKQAKEGEKEEVDDDVTSKPPSKSASKTESERLSFLEADPRAQEIRPHEVLCRSCQKWVRLAATQKYALGNWSVHQGRCCGTSPDSRTATAERKRQLLNDPQAKSSTRHHVECAFCELSVALDKANAFDLTKWNEHKAQCLSSSHAANISVESSSSNYTTISQTTPEKPMTADSSKSSTRVFIRPPVSSASASTEATIIASESPPARANRKRAREDEDKDKDEDERPVIRPRTENYVPPQNKPPGPLGWFLQPFKAFVRGFREGLGTPNSTSQDT